MSVAVHVRDSPRPIAAPAVGFGWNQRHIGTPSRSAELHSAPQQSARPVASSATRRSEGRRAGRHIVAALIKRAKHTSGDNPESIRERTDLMNEIRSELLAHAKAEEAVFYSRLNNQAETREIVEESKAEHQRLEHVLEQLGAVAPSTPGWMQLIEELEQTVQHHVAEEENELFPKASAVLSDDEANAIDEQFRREKQTVLSRVRQHP
jgi:iron-sulfur cluster repair protein YtfE (RIC family)